MNVCNETHLRLASAIESGKAALAAEILMRENNTNFLRPIGPLQVTTLQLAAWKGEVAFLDELYKRGVDVNAQDKIGRCALYYAAHCGHNEVVRWILQRGGMTENRVGLPLPDCWGRTPLHQAVKNNHPDVIRMLVNAGAEVNAQDDRGITPLLLAGSAVNQEDPYEMSKFVETIDILVSAKARTNVIHPDTGTTALHHASALGSSRATEMLLKAGAWPLYQCKGTGIAPLHIAATVGSVDTLLVLLGAIQRGDIDLRDKVSRTSLHRAAYKGHRDCVRALIDHGANLAAETKTGVTVIDAIFANIPRPLSFLTDVLDSCVRTSGSALDTNACVTVDFNVLTPKGELQMGVVAALITAASDVEQLMILQHPLLEAFLRLKWSKLRAFFFILVLVHVVFVLSLSSYSIILLRQTTDCTLPRSVLTLSSCILLFNNMAQVLMVPRHYLKEYETWLSFICASISLVISVAGDYIETTVIHPREEVLNDAQHPPQWVLHSISLAILLGWMQMMLLVGRFPTWGYYALMFSTVLKNILKVLLAFVCLIVGFALSFAVLFHGNDQFRDSWRAVVKTVVMMMGEYEYGDLFADERNKSSFLPATSRVVFLAFVMLASIVLMNLMIGLAVNDIQGLEKEGHIRRLLKQAEFVAHLERVTSHRIFRSNWLHPRLRVLLNSRRFIPTKITFGCHENYIHESSRGIPRELVEALFLLASKNSLRDESGLINEKCRDNNGDLRSLLYKLEQQLRQLKISYYPSLAGRRFSKPFVRCSQVHRRRTTNS